MSGFYPYQTRAVRDLAWACFSPALLHTASLQRAQGLLADACFELTPARRHWLERLDRDAAPLLDYLASGRSSRLGIYFERLWQFFLREDPLVELIAHNVPVTESGRTLGEFDCLYYCRSRHAHVHLELAVKFYLGVPGAPEEQAWVGPNVRDRLDIKLAHLLDRQVTLGDRPAARRQLAALGVDAVEREIALRGYLFQPADDPLPAPTGYNVELPFASWCHLDRLDTQLETLNATSFRLLDRLQWLAPQQFAPHEVIAVEQLADAVHARFAARLSPVLVAALDTAGEQSARFFVVPGDWPVSHLPTD